MTADVIVTIVPVLSDNYAFLVHNSAEAVVVDPGDATPVLAEICRRGLRLTHVLVTHHHSDHTAGCTALRNALGCTVLGPNDIRFSTADRRVGDQDELVIVGVRWTVWTVPGHTRTHVVYYLEEHGIVFTGDTLLGAGCGRVFEGTYRQMWSSLQKLASLPSNTLVYFGHEYTLENCEFACAIAPDDLACRSRLDQTRALQTAGKPTVPSTIGCERLTNLFLRARSVEEFTKLRMRKNEW